jgi:hypothetical protein
LSQCVLFRRCGYKQQQGAIARILRGIIHHLILRLFYQDPSKTGKRRQESSD